MKIKVLGRIVNVTVLAYKLHHSMLVMTTTVSVEFLSGIVNPYIIMIHFGMVTNVITLNIPVVHLLICHGL